DFRPEKRYGGGEANRLYIFDLKSYETKSIAEGPRATRDAMWIGDTIYYNSDRDGHFNLYAYGVGSGKTTQITHSKQWDVRWPSSDHSSRIVYEMDGELQILDVKSGKATPISISVPDDGLARRPSRVSAANNIESYDLSPKGERALFSARGDIFTAPIEKGPTRNLTHSSGAHDKWPSWSPDGSQIAFISDMTGEEELYVIAQDGLKPAQQITTGGQAMRYQPEWSADGKRIAFGDKDGKIFVVTLADKKMTEIVDSPRGQIRDYVFSPSGNYLAFSMSVRESGFASIYIWNAADNKVSRVTDDMFNAGSPVWDPTGNYLYFASQREFAPQISNIEFNYATNRDVYLYAMALRKDVKNPFPAESDEVAVTKAKDESAPAEKKEGEGEKPAEAKPATPAAPPKAMTIDFDGIAGRVARVPVGADNYAGISAKPGFLIYATGPAFYYGRQGDRPAQLKLFSLKDRKETTLIDDFGGGYALSRDGSKILARGGQGFGLYDATPQGDKSRKPVSTAGLVVDRVPAEEWAQIFNEVWRRYRDWFYVPNMHGYDWVALREQYKPLLQYV